MADSDDTSSAVKLKDLKLSLKDFLECFPPPQSGRIVDGYEPDFDTHEAFNLPTGSVLNFHRQVSPNVPLSFRDTWGGSSADHLIKVTLPIEFQGKFRVLPFDPSTGETSPDHVYHTVEDMVKAFPVYVQANCSHEVKGTDTSYLSSLVCGDRLKLIRLVHKYGRKLLECRRLSESRLILLSMACVGDFKGLPDHNEYLLSDLMSMLPRRRRLQVCESSRNTHKIPGLPGDFRGDLLLEEPEAFVEASPMDDPGLIIGLPNNLNITVSPQDNSYDRGQLINTFATNNRNLFPVVARVTDWDEETTILENHYVKPGIELVIHGWTRQSKILASTSNSRHYAIPLTYQGQFRILPHQFNGVSELEHAHPAYKVKVLQVDHDNSSNIAVGDVLRIKRADSMANHGRGGEVLYVRCEKLDSAGRVKETTRLPISSNARFEEILEENKAMNFWIRELVTFVADQELVVELVGGSMDQKVQERDLPLNTPIVLCDFVVEPAVYVSVETAEAPAFHIPLRTLLYVTFVQQLEKSSSPLLTKQNPRLSTLDRCVEVLPLDVFNGLQPRSRGDNELTVSALTAMQQQLNSTGQKTTAWYGRLSHHPTREK